MHLVEMGVDICLICECRDHWFTFTWVAKRRERFEVVRHDMSGLMRDLARYIVIVKNEEE